MRPTTLLGALALAVIALPVGAQDSKSKNKEKSDDAVESVRVWRSGEDDERAVLGISTSSGGERDTLGLLVTSVTAGGPAEKAGIEEGNRIASINGVSLRLAAADAGEPDMNGMMSRRLTREMRKIKAGDEVELRVYGNGAFRNLKIRTIAAEDLPTRRVRMSREDMEERPVLGLSVTSTGSRRDTLGVMVTTVAENGPAETAGVYEGDRIASVNGVDLRVAREDAGDDWMGNARSNRFSREIRKVKVGDDVELRVYSAGQFRTVRVKAARARDVYKSERGTRFFFGDVGAMPPMPPMPPMPAIAPEVFVAPRLAPRARVLRAPQILQLDSEVRDQVERAMQAARAAAGRVQDLELDLDFDLLTDGDVQLDGETVRAEPTPAPRAPATRRSVTPTPAPTPRAASAPFVIQASWTPAAAPALAEAAPRSALELPGLRASRMDRDLAAYFSEDESVGDGLLVIEADERWEGLRVGDVIVSVNGQRVRSGASRAVCLDRSQDNLVEVVRRGKRQTVRVPAA